MKKIFNYIFGSSQFFELHLLHILNDGAKASLLLLLPFIAQGLSINLTLVGLLGTTMNSLSIFFAIPAAYISAKIGGIKTLIFALFLYGLGYLGTGLSTSYFWLFPAFILAGAGFGLFHPIGFALVAKLTEKANIGRQMGNFTATGDIGRIGIAAVLTFVIVYLGWQYTAIAYGIISLVLGFILFFFLKSKNEHLSTHKGETSSVKFIEILTHKKFIITAFASFFDTFASASLFIFLPFLFINKGIEPALLGSFTAVFFVGTLFGKAALGRLADKFGNAKVFIISQALMALFIFFLANSTELLIIATCSIILGIFTKGTLPVMQSMVAEAGEHHGNYEKLFAVNSITASIATTSAPILLGLLSDTLGIISAFNAMAIFAVLAIIPILFLNKN